MIKNFNSNDIQEASKIAHLTWGDFYTNESRELQKLIYDFMVKYYDLNRKYSFSYIENGYKGFILAAEKEDKNNCFEEFKACIQTLNEKEQKTALDLYNYLETCGKLVKDIMSHDDIMLGLFVSIQKGVGKQLLNQLATTCIENDKKNIYLWSDTTCDYNWYMKNGFSEVKGMESLVNNKKISTIIYKKMC